MSERAGAGGKVEGRGRGYTQIRLIFQLKDRSIFHTRPGLRTHARTCPRPIPRARRERRTVNPLKTPVKYLIVPREIATFPKEVRPETAAHGAGRPRDVGRPETLFFVDPTVRPSFCSPLTPCLLRPSAPPPPPLSVSLLCSMPPTAAFSDP